MKYPIYEPEISKYTASILTAIQSGWISSRGEFIDKATELAKKVLGAPYVVLVNNGTSATHLLYKTLKFKHPEITRVYVPDHVFVAVWNAGLYEYPPSAFSVLDMDSATLNMRVDEEYIRGLEPNSAVVVVHNVGNVVNVPRLRRLRPDIVFVEDACEAFLESYEGQVVGTASLCAAVSLFANKLITSGEGGIFYTSDKDVYEFIYKSCHHGMTQERYIYDVLGYNYRMTNLQAALLYDQLCDIESICKTKRGVYERYCRLFGSAVSTTGLWMMILRFPGVSTKDMSGALALRGIDTRPMFYSMRDHAHLSRLGAIPQEIGHDELIMIPSSPSLDAYDQTVIWSAINQYLRKTSLEIVRPTPELLNEFVRNPMPATFRYFQSRPIDICKTHQLTVLGMEGKKPVAYGHIDDRWIGVCVLEGHQSKGHGTTLLDFLLGYARAARISPLRLSVDKANPRAIAMYERRGFGVVRETETVLFMELHQ